MTGKALKHTQKAVTTYYHHVIQSSVQVHNCTLKIRMPAEDEIYTTQICTPPRNLYPSKKFVPLQEICTPKYVPLLEICTPK